MTMITPSYLGETIEYSSLHACRSTLEDPTDNATRNAGDLIKALTIQMNRTRQAQITKELIEIISGAAAV